jgi:hypothetical protein
LPSRQIDEKTKRTVHGCGVSENLCDVGVEEHDVDPLAIRLVMLPTNAAREIVLRPEIVIGLRL